MKERDEQDEAQAGVDGEETLAEAEAAEALGLPVMAVRILDAAMELFARKGYAATSVREIVQRAHVTNPMLYYYFESKEGLFYRLIQVLFDSMERRVSEVLEASTDSLHQQLSEVVRVHLEAASESPQALQFIYSVLFGPRQGRPEVDPLGMRQHAFMEVAQRIQSAIERGELIPRPGFDAMFLTIQLFGMLNQHMMFTLKEMERADTEHKKLCAKHLLGPEAIERIVTFYLGGAGQVKGPDG